MQMSAHRDALHRFAISFTNDIDDANDLVQDTLVKGIRYAAQYNENTNLKAWLYTILKNTFINDYRRKSKANGIFTVTEDISSSQLKKSASGNLGENKCMMDDIQFALKKLHPDYYIPFTKYFEGYKYHEIAQNMDIPIGTVKTRIHIARKMLKKDLKMYSDQFSRAN